MNDIARRPPVWRHMLIPLQMLRLAVADLWHDWILFSCVVCALGAVFSPLLILFGLKQGYLEAMRSQLLHDPRNLELRPREVPQSLKDDWFARVGALPETDFVVGSTPRAPTVSMVRTDANPGQPDASVDVFPTAPGDSLLTHYRLAPPGDEECVLTESAALDLNLSEGDAVVLSVHTSNGEPAKHRFSVRGILPGRAMAKRAAFVTLPVLNRITLFQFGLAVPEYGWVGGAIEASPSYSQVVVFALEKLTAETSMRLQTETGFSHRDPLTPEEILAQYALTTVGNPEIFRLQAVGHPGTEDNLARVRGELNGNAAVLLSSNPPVALRLTGLAGAVQLSAVSLGFDDDAKRAVQTEGLPSWVLTEPGTGPEANAGWRKIAVSAEDFERLGKSPWQATVRMPEGDMTFPVTVEASRNLPAGLGWMTARLGGVLYSGQKTIGMTFDPAHGSFVIQQNGYRSFRLYARDLSGVERLARQLAQEGIKTDSSLEQISSIRALDVQMTSLVRLVGIVTCAGAIGALLTSLLASIERKKREFGVLRLMGTGRPLLLLVPLMQSLVIVGGALLLAVGIFHLFAAAADPVLSEKFEANKSLCTIRPDQLLAAWGVTSVVAVVVALCASVRLFSIEPADAIRWE